MAGTVVAPSQSPILGRLRRALAGLKPTWSLPAGMRALRALLVIPTLFAICSQVVQNAQISLFATFGGFATLVLANFGGTRRDKALAHLGLAATGSALIAIGTVISSSAALASPIAFVVVFVVLLAGIFGANATSGATAALLAFVLPAASPGTASLIPARLEGWWLASAAGTIAVLLLSPRPAGDRLRLAGSKALSALGTGVAALATRDHLDAAARAARDASDDLVNAFRQSPLRPIGIGVADQALGELVETSQWATNVFGDLAGETNSAVPFDDLDLATLSASGQVFDGAARLLKGEHADPPIGALDDLVRRLSERAGERATTSADGEGSVHLSYHVGMIAAAARSSAIDARMVAERRRMPEEQAASPASGVTARADVADAPPSLLSAFSSLLRIHSGLASVSFLNAVRGAVAVAAAVAIADLTNVQHGFWVVLGAVSVLRTNAASTGANAWRALLGTAIGFVIGAALVVGIGGDTGALWAMFPVGVAVAAYAPGTAPFAVGQAAFTVLLTVLYNLIIPVGWTIGVVRIEDVAIGVGVSAVAGVLFWPRGAGGVVRADLAEAFHLDGLFLVQATAWAIGRRSAPPDAQRSAARADVRLGDALRALAAEQGAKHVRREDVWRLYYGIGQLRSTARSLAVIQPRRVLGDEASLSLLEHSVRLAGLCDSYAARVAVQPPTVAQELSGLALVGTGAPEADAGFGGWVREHLDHAGEELDSLVEPIDRVAKAVSMPWWR
jgi:uncharacterized membrane protein YccC